MNALRPPPHWLGTRPLWTAFPGEKKVTAMYKILQSWLIRISMAVGNYCVASPETNYFVLSLAFLSSHSLPTSVFDQVSLWPLSKWVYLTGVDHQLLQILRLRMSSHSLETYSRTPPAWIQFPPMYFKGAWTHDSLCSATVKMSWNCHHAGTWHMR